MGKAKSIVILVLSMVILTIIYRNVESKQWIYKEAYLNMVDRIEYDYNTMYKSGITIYSDEESNRVKINTDGEKYKIVVDGRDKSSIYSIEENSEEYIVLPYNDTEYKVYLYKAVGDKVIALNTINIRSYKENISDYIEPSYYADYRDLDIVRNKSDELWKESEYIEEYISKCIKYAEGFKYDKDKATEAIEGNIKMYKPDIQYTMENKSGICMDIASALAAILRVQGIPASVCFGYKDDLYHAWIEVYYKDEWKIIDSLFGVNEVDGDKAIGYKVESRN